MSSKRVVGVGPSLVDIGVTLPHDQYEACGSILDAQPGDWRRIEDFDRFRELMRVISGYALYDYSSLSGIQERPRMTVGPGSSILGMIGAMPPETRVSSTFVSTLAMNEEILDPMSILFNSAVLEAGINHDYQPVEGFNPAGFVLSSVDNTEKILGMYPGVATELDGSDIAQYNPDLVVLDAYELAEGRTGEFLDEVIRSNKHRIALSLGNHAILTGRIKENIRGYIACGQIDILTGNSLEYAELFSESNPEVATKEGFCDNPVRDAVPYALMTVGDKGSVATWSGKIIHTPAYRVDQSVIVNTSGAGDVSAGIFYAGILDGSDGGETLRKAAYYATRVLQVQSSMILADK